jgi:hypothetical protein
LSLKATRQSVQSALTSATRARNITNQLSNISSKPPEKAKQKHSSVPNPSTKAARLSASHAFASTTRAKRLAEDLAGESASRRAIDAKRSKRRPTDKTSSSQVTPSMETTRVSMNHAFTSTIRARQLAERIDEKSTAADKNTSAGAKPSPPSKEHLSRANLRVQTARTSMSHAFTSTSRAKKLAEQVASASDSASPSPQQAVESTNDSSKRSLDEQTKSKSPRKRPFCYSCVQLCTKQEESESCNSSNRKVVCGWGRRSQKKTAKSVARRYCNQHLQSLSSENSPWRTVLGDCPRASCQLRE